MTLRIQDIDGTSFQKRKTDNDAKNNRFDEQQCNKRRAFQKPMIKMSKGVTVQRFEPSACR